MQVFATSKAPALGGALYQQLRSLTKHRKAVRIMKLTAIFLLGACLQMSAKGISQTITLSLKDVPIQKVFREIERQTEYTFFVESDLFSKAKKVSVEANNLPLNQVLDICFRYQPFTYSFSGRIIMVTPKQNKAVDDVNAPLPQKPVDIRGRVVNSKGEPIADATVSVQGSTKRTITNTNGEFTISGVEDNAVVVITHVQYETMTLPIKGNGLLSATLQFRVSNLDELQVIAYGTTTRRFSTGNIATIKSSDIETQPVQNPLLALQGRVPGIEVTQLTGMPGAGVKIQIQGNNSIGSLTGRTGSDPLIVIDGVPFPAQFINTGYETIFQNGSPLNYINPNDIESIDILKDADATAIYGSRAANGAILITTKKGKAGQTKVDIDIQQGWSKVSRKVDVMNTQQYLEMRHEALKNDGVALSTLNQTYNWDLTVWDTTGRYTDWQKELIGGTGQYTNVNATTSGGATNMQYLIGGTYNRQTNVFPGDFDDKRGALHFNITGSSKDQKFKVQLSGNFMYDKNRLPGIDLTTSAIVLAPNAPSLYKEDGSLNWEPNVAGTSTFSNPLASIFGANYNYTTRNLVQNLNLSYRIQPWLDIRTSIGYTNTLSNIYIGQRLEIEKPERRATSQRRAVNSERDMKSWIFEPQLYYNGTIAKGKLEGVVGGTILQNRATVFSVSATGFTSDLLMESISAATSIVAGTSSTAQSKFNGLFGRLNYSWDKKYILNLTGRRDGSSKFGDANKLHNFWSTGAAWIFSQENLINEKLQFLSFGKLRASYGTTGNDQIGDFGHLSLYSISNSQILYQGGIALQPNKISNPFLQWEETRKMQIGMDLGFINDRILIGATYARNRSSNQLVSYTIPSTAGFTSISQNLPALVQNTSLEFTISTLNLRAKDFLWTASANLTVPRNKVVNFPGIEKTPYASGNLGVIVGEGLGVVKMYQNAGVNPSSGIYQVFDKNGNIAVSPTDSDKTVLFSNFTKYYGGFQNTVSYKGLQLDINFQFVRQLGPKEMYYYTYDANVVPGSFTPSGSTNQSITVLDRWQKAGDQPNIGKYSTSVGSSGQLMYPPLSDAWYSYDASFIRLKNLSLSWQLPSRWLNNVKMQSASIYCHAQNLATITKYSGLDPENKNSYILPPLRVITLGVKIGL